MPALLKLLIELAGWKRSAKGNLWRDCGSLRVCVFERPVGSGYYAWSIADCDGPTFSQRVWPSEEAAVEACMEAVEATEAQWDPAMEYPE